MWKTMSHFLLISSISNGNSMKPTSGHAAPVGTAHMPSQLCTSVVPWEQLNEENDVEEDVLPLKQARQSGTSEADSRGANSFLTCVPNCG